MAQPCCMAKPAAAMVPATWYFIGDTTRHLSSQGGSATSGCSSVTCSIMQSRSFVHVLGGQGQQVAMGSWNTWSLTPTPSTLKMNRTGLQLSPVLPDPT